jgi:hypothetical protein
MNSEKYSDVQTLFLKISKSCPISANLPRRQGIIRESRENTAQALVLQGFSDRARESSRKDQGTLREFLFQIGTPGHRTEKSD